MNRHRFASATGLILSILFAAPAVASHWSTSAEINNPVSTAHSFQQNSVSVADGEGGVIVAWQDLRNELYFYIYAQRLNANGDPLWTPDGVLLSTAGVNQQLPEIVSDGAGGAIVVWDDQRSDTSDLYAQRIGAAGNVLWTPTGVPIAVAANLQALPKAIADGVGGAIISWTDQRVVTTTDIYAQRINSSGTVQWAANGVVVSAAAGAQQRATLATDRMQGAIIAWEDYRNDPSLSDVYAQRVRADGTMAWTANGVPVAVQPFQQRNPVVSYGLGNGAFVVWEDSRAAGTDFHIYYQRLFSTGTPAFAVNGLKLSTDPDNFKPRIADASSSTVPVGNSAHVLWEHVTAGGDKELILNSVLSSGIPIFETPLDFGHGDKVNPHLAVSEPDGGALITWTSDGFYGSGASNVYVTKYYGGFVWGSNGFPVCVADGSQGPVHIVSDAQGGAIVAWDDRRGGVADSDIRAQRLEFAGSVGYSSADISSIVDHPQDQGLQAIVSWNASRYDTYGYDIDEHYSLWRRLLNPTVPSMNPVAASTKVQDARIEDAVKAGISRAVAAQQLATGWELAGTVPAIELPSYALTAATYGDSIDASSPRTAFMVVFETEVGNWFSAAGSGHSQDNLKPMSPLQLVGSTQGPNAQLKWTPPNASPDVVGYRVYRSAAPGVGLSPGNRIASVEDLSHLDLTTGGHPHFYVVTAIDDALLEGPPSNEVVAPIGVTAVETTSPDRLSLAAAGANPFRERAHFRYGLPADAEVSILVYDVTGRQVHDARVGRKAAGWHDYHLDVRDETGRPLRAGAYFLRLRAGADTSMLKFVMLD